MAVHDVSQRIQAAGGYSSPPGQSGVTATASISYDVLVDVGDPGEVALGDPEIPQDKAQHPLNSFMRVSNRTYNRLSPILYEVNIEYSSTTLSVATHSVLDVPADIRYSSEDIEDELWTDVDGSPIQTVTGERFENGLREIVPVPVVMIRRPALWVNATVLAQYRNKTNEDSFLGMAPGTLLMRRLEADMVRTEDFTYWMVNAVIAMRLGEDNGTIDAKAWYRRVLAQGMYVNDKILTGLLIEKTPGLDKNSKPTTVPVNHRLYVGDDPESPATLSGTKGTSLLGEQLPPEKAQFYYFRTKKSKPFNALGLLT